MDRDELVKIVSEKGELWAVSAIVDGSIGYHSPISAKMRVDDLLKGAEVWGCERDCACYGGDGLKAIASDFKYFLEKEKRNPEGSKAIMEAVKVMMGRDSWIEQVGFSMAYPTIAP